MTDKLRDYIDELFKDAPSSKKTVEMKEEILQNLRDRYNDLLEEGKNEEAAYNIAVAGIGDMSELIDELKREYSGRQTADPSMKEEEKRKRAVLVSASVMIYILSIVPLLVFQNDLGLVFMAVLVALATGILIYNSMTKPGFSNSDETIAEEFKQWRESNNNRKSVFKSVSAALWAITLVIYFLLSFGTGYWHITWLIFPIAVAVNSIIRILMRVEK